MSTDLSTDTKLKEIIAEQEEIFVRRQPASARLAGQATEPPRRWRHLQLADHRAAAGLAEPRPRLEGLGRRRQRVRRPARRLRRRAGRPRPPGHRRGGTEQAGPGTHFAQPTPDAIAVADELARRFGLPLWRFANSGTEATMDAVHLMRSITGRDLIIKIEGCYHGHHDSVQVSVPPRQTRRARDKPSSAPASTGIPKAITDLTLIAPFNDLAAWPASWTSTKARSRA